MKAGTSLGPNFSVHRGMTPLSTAYRVAPTLARIQAQSGQGFLLCRLYTGRRQFYEAESFSRAVIPCGLVD